MTSLYIQNISKSFGKIKALDKVELAVEQGDLMVIMGPSGCGKTTLLLVILGALRPDEGQIWMGDREITNLKVEERNIGYVPQDLGLFPHLSVYENIAFGLKIRGYSKIEIDSKARNLLRIVNLEGLEARKPKELSGGQRQRVALARALAINPSLLLLDEPLNNIDEATKADVIGKLKGLQREIGITTICVTHNPEDAFKLGDHIAIMYLGKIIQCGKPEEILKEPKNDVVKRLVAPMYALWNKLE